jgi:hypothetical protein
MKASILGHSKFRVTYQEGGKDKKVSANRLRKHDLYNEYIMMYW